MQYQSIQRCTEAVARSAVTLVQEDTEKISKIEREFAMDENILITSNFNKKTFQFISVLNIFFVIAAVISFFSAVISCDDDQYLWVLMTKTGNYYSKPTLLDYGAFWIAVLFVLLIAAGIIIKKAAKNCTLTVAEDRIYGISIFKKRVDLPVDSISSISKSLFSGLSVATSSGLIKFVAIKNRDEIYECIVKLLSIRQSKNSNASNQVVLNNQSNADELKKYKELLDGGVITQEEFDAKKKQLLGL